MCRGQCAVSTRYVCASGDAARTQSCHQCEFKIIIRDIFCQNITLPLDHFGGFQIGRDHSARQNISWETFVKVQFLFTDKISSQLHILEFPDQSSATFKALKALKVEHPIRQIQIKGLSLTNTNKLQQKLYFVKDLFFLVNFPSCIPCTESAT